MKKIYAKIITGIFLAGGFYFVIIGIILNGHPSITIEWSTASELDTAGFNLYRSDSQKNEGIKVNNGLIPASSDPLDGGNYTYEDNQVVTGIIYFYTLEEIETSGKTNILGQIQVEARRAGLIEGITGLLLIICGFSVFLYSNRI